MKILKYKKVLACVCALILLFVFFTFPAAASSTFMISSKSQPYFTPGDIAFNFNISSYYDPPYYYVSHSIDPLLGDYFDIPYRDDFQEEQIFNTDQSNYSLSGWFIDEYIIYNSSRSDLTILDNGDLSGLASFTFNTCLEFDPNLYYDPSEFSSIIISDFYCWNNDDLYDFTCETVLYIQNFSSFADVDSIDVVYRNVGTSELLTNSLALSVVPDFMTGNFEICPEDIDGNSRLDAVYYVDSLVINLSSTDGNDPFSGYLNYVYYPGLEAYDLSQAAPTYDDNPAFSLAPYTAWLANAVGGFMDFEIYHHFTIGGIFMTIIAFACTVWFLKLVAGG